MNYILTLCFIFLQILASKSQTKSPENRFEVYLFLLEDCKITQAYTDKLQYLHRTFACDSIRFSGYFPNPVSEAATMQSFVEKYQLPFPCTRDGAYDMAKRFGVTVTPEVVVYNETQDSVYYQGRIDNLFERVGQRRQVLTSHEMETALYRIQHNKPVPIRAQQQWGRWRLYSGKAGHSGTYRPAVCAPEFIGFNCAQRTGW